MIALAMVLMTQPHTITAAISADSKVNVTVEGIEKGTKVSMYKLIDMQIENGAPKAPVYTWRDEVKDWVTTNYASYIGSNGEVRKTFKEIDEANAKTFYEKIAAEIHKASSSITITGKTETATSESLTFTDVELGCYLVTASQGTDKVYTPTGLNIAPSEDGNTWDVENQLIRMKSSQPAIVKTVTDPTDQSVAIGDEVTYQLSVQIPTYPEAATAIAFHVGDKVSEGLSLQSDTIEVKDVDGNIVANNVYTLNTTPGKTSKDTEYSFEISFTEDYIKANPSKVLHISYKAKVNQNALTQDSLKNVAYIGYYHDPYDTTSYKEKTDEKNVYTYGIIVEKVGEDETSKLKNAEFSLSKEGETTALTFSKASDGSYVLDPKGNTVLSVGTSGEFTIQGLDEGTYILKETKVPDGGYVLPDGEITLKISDTSKNGVLDNGEAVLTTSGAHEIVGNAELVENKVKVIVKNSKTTDIKLPVTGGAGTLMFSVVGIVLMCGGAAMIIRNKKKHA